MADLSQAEQDAIVKVLTERYDYASREWYDIRREGAIDMRFVGGDPWKPSDRRAREDANRPCLSLDEIGQYVNQLINEVRQHKRAIKVSPMSNGTEAIARVRANLMRQIEYRSNAQQAYTTMFENAVQRSYGYARIEPRYESPRSFYQELIIKAVENPDMVTPDPDDLSPTGATMQYCFYHEWWNIADFVKRWPKAKVKGYKPEYEQAAKKWWRKDRVQVAEYWTIETEDRELWHLQTPEGSFIEVFADEMAMPADDANPEVKRRWLQKWGQLYAAYSRGLAPQVNARTVPYPRVYQYMTNGIELLPPDPEKPERLRVAWPGTSIPFIACYGKVLWIDDGVSQRKAGDLATDDEGTGSKRKILSLPRLARDPAMLYCYYRTAEAEQVGMSTKFPYFIRRGSLTDEQKNILAKSLHEPVAFIEVEAMSDRFPPGVMPEMPVRNPFEPAIQALEVGAEGARRAIQAAMGIMPLPTNAQRQNDKSGVALERIKSTSQQGSYHFIDHYDMALTEIGRKLDELLPHYYDAMRDVTTRTPADEVKMVRINDPQQIDQESGQPLMLTEDSYDITLSTGPAFDSEREQASEYADGIAANVQHIAGIIGPQAAAKLLALTVKLKNVGPIGDEIAETISPSMKGGKPSPEMLQRQLEEAQQIIQAMQAELAEAKQALETDAIKAQRDVALQGQKTESETSLKLAQIQADIEKQFRDLEVKLEVELAKIGSAQALARGEQEMQELHHHDEMALRREENATAEAQQTLDRKAAQEEAATSRAFEADQNERNRQQPEPGA